MCYICEYLTQGRTSSLPGKIYCRKLHDILSISAPLQLSFENKNVRKLCEDADEASIHLGVSAAEVLRRRLADLISAKTVFDMPSVGNLRACCIDGIEFYQIDLSNNYVLSFGVGHGQAPLREGNVVDWSLVTRIKILKIATYA